MIERAWGVLWGEGTEDSASRKEALAVGEPGGQKF